MKKNCVVIFAKYPSIGKVKTRLGRDIGMKPAAILYKAMLEDIVSNLSNSRDFDLVLCFDPKNKEKNFKQMFPKTNLYPQSKGDLAEKMLDCFSHFLSEYQYTCVIGSDVPTISKSVVNKAFSKLGSRDIVLGKAADGGFYLIGMKENHDIFQNVDWSTELVLKQTIKNSTANRLTYALLPSIVEVDTVKDLQQLRKLNLDKKSINTLSSLKSIKM